VSSNKQFSKILNFELNQLNETKTKIITKDKQCFSKYDKIGKFWVEGKLEAHI
jgi:hypothetical protein